MNLGCDATHFHKRTGHVPSFPSARLLYLFDVTVGNVRHLFPGRGNELEKYPNQSVTTFVRSPGQVFGRWRLG